ncbi:AMP-binding protein [Amycolatopsis acidicola]|uniref:AMP-binding protein n=1 Tax=Amycolatopsis acidicola TaxID=2596893 RepID=A0A5N0VI37_9PSEU|nr:AMP-binding protein [Amycolatopsis acidicola]KAA9166019.1 AMP-binding protein [Amycolatopsis acidicola]
MSTAVENPPAEQWRRMSHGEQLARAARRFPDRIAVRCGDRSVTYRVLDQRVTRVAHGLRGLGITAGSRVAILMRNTIEVAEIFYACARIGAIAVPVNHRLVADEVGYILRDSGAGTLVGEGTLGDVAIASAQLAGISPVVLTSPAEAGENVLRYEDLVASSPDEPLAVDVPDGSPMAIMYTSGTTGSPKGAVIPHSAMTLQSLARAHIQQLVPGEEVWLSGLQLFHVGGLNALVLSILLGGQVIMLAPRTRPAEIVDLLERHRVTTCSLVPTQWQEVCAPEHIEHRSFHLRSISWGTAPAGPDLLRRLDEVFGQTRIFNIFGQTETSGTACTLTGDEARNNRGSVGRPVLNVEVRIVDEEMRDVPAGDIGEIVYRGPTIMTGYWNKTRETAEAFAGGWFHSGDLARMDSAGLLWIVDRKKDLIISGGENIYPAELERVIGSHPKVSEVAVVGTPHERWGESPLAVVVPADPLAPPTESEIIEHCREKLASYKKPGAVVITAALPRNATGKVQKFRLREIHRSKGEQGERTR